jgi:hypothetical protein
MSLLDNTQTAIGALRTTTVAIECGQLVPVTRCRQRVQEESTNDQTLDYRSEDRISNANPDQWQALCFQERT